MYEGLIFAWSRGFHQIEVESDNSGLIELICNGYAADNKLSVLCSVHALCRRDWRV